MAKICFFMSGVWTTLDTVGYDQSPLIILNLGKYNNIICFNKFIKNSYSGNYFNLFLFASRSAENNAPAFCLVSKYSLVGTESITIPAPDWT